MNAELVVDVWRGFGEGPSWVEAEQALLWIAAPGQVHRFHPDTMRNDTYVLDRLALAVVACESGRYLIVQSDSLATLDPESGVVTPLAAIPDMPAGTRLNDAKTDPSGRFWFGSLEAQAAQHVIDGETDGPPPGRTGTGGLYRMDHDGTIEKVLGDIGIGNGMGWSPDFRTMYFVDTASGLVDQLDFDPATGTASNRRDFVRIPAAEGHPDGMAVDADGGVWVAMFGGGCLQRYGPDGELTDRVQLPVRQVTSCAFGGENLEDLYVTTAGVAREGEAGDPHGGSVFRLRPAVGGLPTWPLRDRWPARP